MGGGFYGKFCRGDYVINLFIERWLLTMTLVRYHYGEGVLAEFFIVKKESMGREDLKSAVCASKLPAGPSQPATRPSARSAFSFCVHIRCTR